mgnify:CR=1 FL=1
MSPGDPALALPLPAPDQGAVPDYVQSLERAASYLPDAQRAQLRRAWAVGAAAHAGQTRKSGEPYITHPVAVAQVLAAGRAPDTSVAFVESGWTPQQRTTVTTLEKAVWVAEHEGVRAPAVVVIGDVVGLRDRLGDLVGPGA